MAARFTDTQIWDEDWFIELGLEYQHFWNYITDQCNHAGIWKPNKTGFEMRTKAKVNLDSFYDKVNGDKERIIKLRDGNWFLVGFIKFQWFNKKDRFDLVLANRMHRSMFELLTKHSVPLEKIRGLREVLETSKDKDKDKDIIDEYVKEKTEEIILEDHSSLFKQSGLRPNDSHMDMDLSEIDIFSCIQFMRGLKQIDLTKEQVNSFWSAFKIQYFNGEKHYNSWTNVKQHFRDWLKFQKPVDIPKSKGNGDDDIYKELGLTG
jgi:hypothetical protein